MDVIIAVKMDELPPGLNHTLGLQLQHCTFPMQSPPQINTWQSSQFKGMRDEMKGIELPGHKYINYINILRHSNQGNDCSSAGRAATCYTSHPPI